MFFDRKTVFLKTELLFDSINTVYLLINSVFQVKNIEKHSFSATNRVYQRQMYNISKNYVFRLINIVFCDKLCFFKRKTVFFDQKILFITDKQFFFDLLHIWLAIVVINTSYTSMLVLLQAY